MWAEAGAYLSSPRTSNLVATQRILPEWAIITGTGVQSRLAFGACLDEMVVVFTLWQITIDGMCERHGPSSAQAQQWLIPQL